MRSKVTILVCLVPLAASLSAGSPGGSKPAGSADIIITNASPEWVLIPSPAGTFTFGLPASIPGCGAENETDCEPTGIFYGNIAWSGIPSYISLSDDSGISDIITFDSDGRMTRFKVMVRPLKAINLLHRLMGEELMRQAKEMGAAESQSPPL